MQLYGWCSVPMASVWEDDFWFILVMGKLRLNAEVSPPKGSDASSPTPRFCMNTGKTWKDPDQWLSAAPWLPGGCSSPLAGGFPPLLVRGDPCMGPPAARGVQQDLARLQPGAAGGNLPTRRHGTGSINYSRFSWGRGIIKWWLQVDAVNWSGYWKPLPSIWWLSL